MELPVAWEEMGRSVGRTEEAVDGTGAGRAERSIVVVGMDKYSLASELAFYGAPREGGRLRTASRNLFGLDGLMCNRWASPETQAGKRLLLVSFKPADLSGRKLAPWIQEAGELRSLVVAKGGDEVCRFYYRIVWYNGHPGGASGAIKEVEGAMRTPAVSAAESPNHRPG
jgi:dolichol-phosphate mannosyltransferase